MKEKLVKFVKENGFLLFLFICVGVVAFSTIYVVTQEVDPKGGELLTKEQMKDLPAELNKKEASKNIPKKEVPKVETPKVETPKKEVPKVEVPKEKPKQENNLNKEKEESKPIQQVKEQKPQKIVKEEEVRETFSENTISKDDLPKEKEEPQSTGKFIMPVGGKIITEFTKDNLIYSKTLDEWRAHPGIDIAAKIGEKVKAPLDGRVKEINEDPLWGKVVILDHGNGLLTKFANLGDTNMIKKDLKVKRGDYIAVVGKTADIEMLMESHLHFEVIKNGNIVDPRSIP
ncbi:M23 family metallopeptidase [Tissierella creatinophila]|uniref:Murein hydrolase activator NlpD n=1 Tax=Tissierella creatinophila DSM 6911 TaxID=1123403 RepID=A0A1U7M3D9_TISCR|nr:M23 family metallopeptidase [Tissierella creatinophila]OLS01834.1 murein hydrolase activator NlpD precursor [Tissierella creatinophila DSM 6911]